MNKEEIKELIEKLRGGRPLRIKGFRADVDEYERYADQLEDDLNMYVDNDSFENESEILADIRETFSEVDDYDWNDE